MMKVTEIFKMKPSQCNSIGDSFLWDDLEQSYRELKLPYSEECFLEKLHLCIEEITGERLDMGEDIDVVILDSNGTSNVKISYDLWMHTVIPILIKRLNEANSRIREQYEYGKVISFPISES